MDFITELLKKIIEICKHERFTQKIIHCNSKWQNNTKKSGYINSPGCPIYLDNRCCVDCTKLKTCQYRCQRSCFVWQYQAFGKPIEEREEVRKYTKDDFQFK